jgi:hypothetical protein
VALVDVLGGLVHEYRRAAETGGLSRLQTRFA